MFVRSGLRNCNERAADSGPRIRALNRFRYRYARAQHTLYSYYYQTLYHDRPKISPYRGKRAADEDLLARLVLYEDPMRRHRIDFTGLTNFWASSGLERRFLQPVSAPPTRVNTPFCEQLQNPPPKLLHYRDNPALHPTPPLQGILTGDRTGLH
ncbi:hypothetical protein ACRE_018350 [Hapsidospora chrysogenum ATCC 11550]|uniref:Uncharacterized protein n=1 Tax=Hapsidospora chrysogenum (strain ATCC 11550 / CBS 779.69 / DSM 880 / IAM 14645 / JCM 23072 / IMI 49137) TaxID=857340 RepID=A0A086TDA3_HAPC1|nr:hypothetical protein ACRE_018350 [Hapsidospora chrysogenum ATCC 11550]